MDESQKFLLPKPDFSKKNAKENAPKPIYLTPSGMTLLPREKQPPPMYGPKGSTIPPKFLAQKIIEETPQEKHFCEPCEMELYSLNDYRRHRAQHEKCPIEGCSYKGHPSVMDKHVIELHNSGIFEKIKKISTPEEIAAWREERRKKYPTVANAEIRKLAQEQRERRGERLGENKSRFGRHEDRKRARKVDVIKDHREKMPKHDQNDRRNKRKEKRSAKNVTRREKQAPIAVNETVRLEENTEEAPPFGMRKFKGTSKMKDYRHEKEKKSKPNNILSSMLGIYGSDDDDDDEEDDEEKDEAHESSSDEKEVLEESNNNDHNQHTQPAEKLLETRNQETILPENETNPDDLIKCSLTTQTPSDLEPLVKDITNANEDQCATQKLEEISSEAMQEEKSLHGSSDEAPDEAPIEHSDCAMNAIPASSTLTNNLDCEASTSKSSKFERSKEKQKRKYGLDYRKLRLRRQNTMLEKLLEPDVRRERNVLLQCVRFVCQNNFFGIGSENKSTGDLAKP